MTVQELNEGIISKIATKFRGGVPIVNKFKSIKQDFSIDTDTKCKLIVVKGGEKVAYECYNTDDGKLEHIVNFNWKKFMDKISKELREIFLDNGDTGDVKIVFNKIEPLFTTNDGHYKRFDPLIKIMLIGDVVRGDEVDKNGITLDIKFGKCDDKKCEIAYRVKVKTRKGKIDIRKMFYLEKNMTFNKYH